MTDEKETEIKKRIYEGVEKMRDSNALRQFLQQSALLHTYSFRNVLLILSRCKSATLLKTYDQWKKDGRYVKLGETGIEIVRPTKTVVRGADGQPITRIEFLTKTVFDISQTEGKDVQEQRREPIAGADRYEQIYQAAEKVSPYKIVFEQLHTAQGYCSANEKKIAIKMGLQDETILQVLFYQMAQATLMQTQSEKKQEQRLQAEAEGITFLLLGYFRIGGENIDCRCLLICVKLH